MLLTVDVGNTNITFGLFKGEDLKYSFRMMTKQPRTSDEYGVAVMMLLQQLEVKKEEVEGIIIASVVPDLMHSLVGGLERYVGKKPLIVGPGVKTGIKIVTENPREIGADRIVDAVGAFEKYGGPVLVMDFGTATTYDLISASGEFLAGITAPGIRISAKALWQDTAKLPEIEIKKPDSILAQNTVTSMQAGLVYGQIGQTEYMVKKVKEESGLDDLKVVATGGLGSIIADETDCIEVYDRMLTLDGLRLIYEKNCK
ncbi:MAG: type III pantothenate kinase [Lachnospiraceae bacterium]|nr:type III pantothenate kinase [Lachnospiraceae bacterium]